MIPVAFCYRVFLFWCLFYFRTLFTVEIWKNGVKAKVLNIAAKGDERSMAGTAEAKGISLRKAMQAAMQQAIVPGNRIEMLQNGDEIYPAMLSFALVAFLFILQRLIADGWALITRSDPSARDGLVPVLAGFALSVAALPLLALIWGARTTDLAELWTRFRSGISIGVSPSARAWTSRKLVRSVTNW